MTEKQVKETDYMNSLPQGMEQEETPVQESLPDTGAAPEAPVEERPNRKAFSERFSKRHKDVDFEDKEARYQALSDDDDRLGKYETSGKALSGVFEKHRWMASMFEALRENDDLDPITWMADNGIDIGEALEDEEYRKKISQKIAEFQKREIEGASAEKERETNLNNSAQALASLGLSDDENSELWGHLWNEVINPALRGEVSKETWELVRKAKNYDSDIQSATETSAMKARNEKIRNKVSQVDAGIPPSLSQGGGGKAEKPVKKKGGFWEGME